MITNVPLVPKREDGVLWVLVIGRVSTIHQDIQNIDASYLYVERHLQQLWKGPMRIKHLGEQGSGMLTERATILEATDEIATGRWDLVIMEDLSKVYRNPRWQYAFVQDAIDAETRVILIGDNIDTADDNWEVAMGTATLRHGLHIPDTRRRVRRTADYSFQGGGMVQKHRFGYRKLTKEQAQSGEFGPPGLRIAKLPECTPTIQEMKNRYMAGQSDYEIAVWLNEAEVPPGPYSKRQRWTAAMVEDLLADPILSRYRQFRKVKYKPIYNSGKHKREKNDQPEIKLWPCLAHLSEEEGERLRAEVARRRAERATGHGVKRRNVPRAKSIWPGQAATCSACGDLLYYMGKSLKCRNCRREAAVPCWNHVQVPAELARERFIDWLLGAIDSVPGTREVLVETAWNEIQALDRQRKPVSTQRRRSLGIRKAHVHVTQVKDVFDCSYEEWVTLFRDQTRQAAPGYDNDKLAKIEPEELPGYDDLFGRAQSIVLGRDTELVRRGSKWVICHCEGILQTLLPYDFGLELPGDAVLTKYFDSPLEAFQFLIRMSRNNSQRYDRQAEARKAIQSARQQQH